MKEEPFDRTETGDDDVGPMKADPRSEVEKLREELKMRDEAFARRVEAFVEDQRTMDKLRAEIVGLQEFYQGQNWEIERYKKENERLRGLLKEFLRMWDEGEMQPTKGLPFVDPRKVLTESREALREGKE